MEKQVLYFSYFSISFEKITFYTEILTRKVELWIFSLMKKHRKTTFPDKISVQIITIYLLQPHTAAQITIPNKGNRQLSIANNHTKKYLSKTWIEQFYNPIAFSMQNFEIIIGFVILQNYVYSYLCQCQFMGIISYQLCMSRVFIFFCNCNFSGLESKRFLAQRQVYHLRLILQF